METKNANYSEVKNPEAMPLMQEIIENLSNSITSLEKQSEELYSLSKKLLPESLPPRSAEPSCTKDPMPEPTNYLDDFEIINKRLSKITSLNYLILERLHKVL